MTRSLYTGPVGVTEVADKMRAAGYQAQAGTEHVHYQHRFNDAYAEANHLKTVIGWRPVVGVELRGIGPRF